MNACTPSLTVADDTPLSARLSLMVLSTVIADCPIETFGVTMDCWDSALDRQLCALSRTSYSLIS